ncbi:uncharacterized protein LOC126966544 [Leptidea sinapis]|uniref:uncharacterized protein LOC126966544 n=1 Tax=Leptidea sinapis TaxID=189913 RepID=UPI00213D89E2|nr:uncharacterized protein LOC126966544 [Leptidea sinapis]
MYVQSSREKKLLREFLKIYIDKTCLWDRRDLSYYNDLHRTNALKELHEKYVEIFKDATIADMKKRINNSRTICHKEVKKVLAAKARGESYKPTLWYYDILAAIYKDYKLDIDHPTSSTESSSHDDDKQSEVFFDNDEYSEPEEHLDHEYFEPELKRRKSSSFLHLADSSNSNDDEQRFHASTSAISTRATATKRVHPEINAFGNTVAFQLNEVDEYQRFVAEKLISDIVFKARIKKLTPESLINL